MEDDLYKTITKPAQGELFKDKNSKFYGYAFPITDEAQVKAHIEDLKKEHYSAVPTLSRRLPPKLPGNFLIFVLR